jgi:hypothetical protein
MKMTIFDKSGHTGREEEKKKESMMAAETKATKTKRVRIPPGFELFSTLHKCTFQW